MGVWVDAGYGWWWDAGIYQLATYQASDGLLTVLPSGCDTLELDVVDAGQSPDTVTPPRSAAYVDALGTHFSVNPTTATTPTAGSHAFIVWYGASYNTAVDPYPGAAPETYVPAGVAQSELAVPPDYAAGEDAVWQGEETPPVDVVVAADTSAKVLRRVSETYPVPTLDAVTGRPVGWGPSSTVVEDWGTVGIDVGGVDVTRVRGVQTVLGELMLQEPYGEGPATLLVPGASKWDEGRAGFEWLAVEKDVNISRFNAAGVYVRTLWTGIVFTKQHTRAGWELGLSGSFAGPGALLPHRPKLTDIERDWGTSMVYAIRRASMGAARRKTITAVTIGITTRDRGARSESLLDYVGRGLSMCQTEAGDQWTLGRVLDSSGHPIRRKYGFALKDRTTQHLTVFAGARGVEDSLQADLSDVTRLIMGEGVSAEGARWRNTKLPNVGKETVPTYPGSALTVGSTGDSVLVWQAEMASDGYTVGSSEALGTGVFTAVEAAAARELQRDAGLPVTGIVNQATWDATWSNGASDLNLGGAAFHPIATDARVEPWLYSSNGSVLARNPARDATLLPLGRFVSYGQGVTKKQARAWARAELGKVANPGLAGTITLDGVDPVEMSRLDIREGMNVRLMHAYGNPLLHVAGVRWSRSGPSWSVSLTVDTRARDLLPLNEIAARNKAAKLDPARRAISQLRRSAQHRDTPGVWDSEGGYGVLPARACNAGSWTVFVIAGGQYGSLQRVIVNTSPHTRYCLALFGMSPGTAWLNSNCANPLVDQGDNGYRFWDRPSRQEGLHDRLFIEAWGEFNQRAGYSPGYETHPESGKPTGHSVTGRLDVLSSTDYGLASEPRLYVAVWAEVATTIKGVVRLLPNE